MSKTPEISERMRLKEEEDSKRDEDYKRLQRKLISKSKQDLLMLNADADGAHRSGLEFREVATGNGYVDYQVIAAIHAQAKNKAKFQKDGQKLDEVVVPAEYKLPSEMLEYVEKRLRRELAKMEADERPYTLGSEEAAREIMERFWVKWAEDLGDGPVESRLQAKQDKWENVWRNLRFWYDMSPEQMLSMLERRQAEAWDLDLECSDERLKKHFLKLILPMKPGFNNSRPKWVEALMVTPGARLSGTLLRRWYDEFQLDSSKPLAGENMDPNGPSMKNQSGDMGPVPIWRRTVEMGFPPGSSSRKSTKKRSSSDSVERNEGLESAATNNSAQLAAMQLELVKLREQAQQSNRGTERQGKPQGKNAPIDLIKEPWRRAVSQAQYVHHWKAYPGDKLCPFYAVYCNLPEALAQQKKLNKSVCNCIGGYSLATGQQKHEDYTAQATSKERRKVYSDLKAMDQRSG
jgi:hypothetical protein